MTHAVNIICSKFCGFIIRVLCECELLRQRLETPKGLFQLQDFNAVLDHNSSTSQFSFTYSARLRGSTGAKGNKTVKGHSMTNEAYCMHHP